MKFISLFIQFILVYIQYKYITSAIETIDVMEKNFPEKKGESKLSVESFFFVNVKVFNSTEYTLMNYMN